ncbi:LacI family transcriptional regulator [Microbacterium caowuchunii]|uniref:LacI family DNA-binding transcriptional regulator n=1 Tax=Microbacterium caowuchunii TaxID=2614638 RepID=UPI001244B697|nr:LacI family DNA-binding transcriptional regulator [Microbacterium caowuchunii]QEW00963.1 LacI family transcriptional regulator [Microbacterium caowuchunii]
MQVSVRDVAAAAGVSVGTVSNALNKPDRVAPETLSRVQAAIEELGFVRNDAARQLRAGRSRTIGLMVLDARNPFFMDIARGAEERAAEHGLSVLIANSDDRVDRESTHLDLFEEQRVFGILATPVSDPSPRLAGLPARGIPVVLVDRASRDTTIPSVSVDDVVGGGLAAAHLTGLGRRRVAFVGGPLGLRQVADRLEGAERAVAEVADASLEVIGTRAPTVAEGRAAGERIAARPPELRPDAVFAANDLVALGLLQSLAGSGALRIPEEIAIVGYDDIDFAAAAVVPLSSIRQPAALIGRRAVELLLAEGTDAGLDRQVRFEPELVVRDSTRG